MKFIMTSCLGLFGILAHARTMYGDVIKHLPAAPSWEYSIQGNAKVGPVGSDFCDLMETGIGCQGVNILIDGPAAQAIFNNLTSPTVNGIRRARGIECSISQDGLRWQCLMHVRNQSVGAGELPWISD